MGVRRVTEGRLFKENGKRKPVTRTLWFSGFIVPNNSWEAYLLFARGLLFKQTTLKLLFFFIFFRI